MGIRELPQQIQVQVSCDTCTKSIVITTVKGIKLSGIALPSGWSVQVHPRSIEARTYIETYEVQCPACAAQEERKERIQNAIRQVQEN